MQERISWGLQWGVGGALFYSLAAIGLAVIGIGLDPGDLFKVILAYWAGGVAAGSLVGILRPLGVGSNAGAALVGLIAAVPIFFAVGVAMFGFSGWPQNAMGGVVISALYCGPIAGIIVRKRF